MFLETVLAACAALSFSTAAYTQEADPTPPAKVTRAEFAKLEFLEGKWRGHGYKTPFFESYRFVNDSTIEMRTSEDATFAKTTPGSRIVWRNGSVYSESDGKAGYAVTRIDIAGHRFSAINRPGWFVWKQVSANEWTAVLSGGAVYRMERLK
jgi:hypothetical protein